MKMTTIKTNTYHIRETYFVDIVADDVTYQAYLYNEKYCVKQLMFGVSLTNTTYEEFLDLVEGNLEEYIQYYKDEVEDQEDEICQL